MCPQRKPCPLSWARAGVPRPTNNITSPFCSYGCYILVSTKGSIGLYLRKPLSIACLLGLSMRECILIYIRYHNGHHSNELLRAVVAKVVAPRIKISFLIIKITFFLSLNVLVRSYSYEETCTRLLPKYLANFRTSTALIFVETHR